MLPGVGRALIGRRHRLGLPALPRLLRGGARALPLRADRAAGRLAAAAGAAWRSSAAQPALLYGYSLWGGIKEMTAAFLLALGVALAAPLLRRRAGELARADPARARRRGADPDARDRRRRLGGARARDRWPSRGCGARRAPRARAERGLARLAAAAITAACVRARVGRPVGASSQQGDLSTASSPSGQSARDQTRQPDHPLSGFQLAGHLAGRRLPPYARRPLPSALLIGLVAARGGRRRFLGARRRQFGLASTWRWRWSAAASSTSPAPHRG